MTMDDRRLRRAFAVFALVALPAVGHPQALPSASSAASPPPIVATEPAPAVSTPPPPAPDDPIAQAIYARVLQMTPLDGGPVSRPDAALGKAVTDFYAQRRFAPAWADETNIEQLMTGIASVDGDGLLPEDYHLSELRAAVTAPDWATASPARRAEFDVSATAAYITVLMQLVRGKVDPVRFEPTWNFDPAAIDPRQGMTMLQTSIEERSIDQAFAAARPQNPLYAKLRDALTQLRAAAAQGGWPHVPDGPSLKPGMEDIRVLALRARLVAGGYLDPTLADGERYDNPLTDAVKRFQADQYLDADGSVGSATLAALNISVQDRIGQVRVNLERARWLLHSLQGTFVVVDVAGYKISYYRDGKPVWKSRVQVGKPYRSTPIFRSQITYVTFNPTWTVPPTILRNDVLPKIRKNASYLANNRIRVLNSSGEVVSPGRVNWANPRGITLRQDAGPGNSLGRVAIRFPNSYSVYLHDTPHQELFEQAKRDTSSGCIRVERPLELVELLFNDPEKWSRQTIDERIATGKTQNVTLPAAVPILIAYWTVDIGEDGKLAYKPDVYRRDGTLLAALDKPQPLRVP